MDTLVPIKPYINHQLVEDLEELLADARSGELIACAWVCRWSNNKVSDGWSSLDKLTKHDLVARLEVLKAEIIRYILEKEAAEDG